MSAPDMGAKHFRRTTGSRILWLAEDGGAGAAGMLSELIRDKLAEDVTEEARAIGVAFGECRYFRVPLSAGAVEAVALLSELSDEELASVKLAPAAHKAKDGSRRVEFVAASLPTRPTSIAHIIVGHATDAFTAPDEKTAVVYTWYPGRLTANVALDAATVKLG